MYRVVNFSRLRGLHEPFAKAYSRHGTSRNPLMTPEIRHDWTLAELQALHDQPLLDLVYRAASVHRRFHDPREMQVSKLISIKTGACPEDCAYCAQSSRYSTGIDAQKLMPKAYAH